MSLSNYASPIGNLELEADDRELVAIRIGATARSRAASPLHPVLDAAARALDAYFGKRFARVTLPFAWHRVPPFHRKVLETLWLRIPAGETLSYKRLAELSGSPRAFRAVGTAMARNPWPILVPCHRVLASHGIGGFGPGVGTKRILLAHEATAVSTLHHQP